jgi:hypothetical protein
VQRRQQIDRVADAEAGDEQRDPVRDVRHRLGHGRNDRRARHGNSSSKQA